MKRFFAVALAVISLSACSSKTTKKVLVMGKGTLTANGNTVNYKEGSGYAETIAELKDEKESKLTVDIAGQKKEITIPADGGFYVLNLRSDTVTGSRQNLGSDLSSSSIITQEQLKVKIDSMKQLASGIIPPTAKEAFIIAPNAVAKISANLNARVYGPFTKIPASLDADPDGKPLELFKFRTNNEMREVIETMEKATH